MRIHKIMLCFCTLRVAWNVLQGKCGVDTNVLWMDAYNGLAMSSKLQAGSAST